MLRLWRRDFGTTGLQGRNSPLLAGLVLGVAGVLVLGGCEEKKRQRPSAQVNPDSKPEGSPQGTGTGTGGSNTGNGDGQQSVAEGDYMTPIKRPADFEGRPVKETDIFFSAVHYKSSGQSWFKTCTRVDVGGKANGVGCTHPGQGEEAQPEFQRRKSLGVAPDQPGQSVELVFETYRPKVVPCGSPEATSSNSTTGDCPGPMSAVSLPERRGSSHGGALKCLKTGSVYVIFYEDQSQGETDPETGKRLYNNFQRNRDARASMKMADGGVVPEHTDLRKIFDEGILGQVYTDSSGATNSEKDLRGRYGIDYGDVIIQIDLGNAGHKLVGFEDCK